MATIQIEANVTPQELLRAIEQLPPEEVRRFVDDLLRLQAERQAPCLTTPESNLLLQINKGLPDPLRTRYQELVARRGDEALNAQEQDELLQLTEQIEQLQAERVDALVQLAQLRHTSLHQLMDELGIQAPAHD